MSAAVVVAAAFPPTPRSGGDIRAHRLVSALARRIPVTVAMVGDVSDIEAVRASTGARRVVAFPRIASPWRKRGTALRRGWPLRVAREWQPALAAWLASTDAVIVLDQLRMGCFLPGSGRYVLSLHNHDSLFVRGQRFPRSPLRAVEHLWERATVPRFERSLVGDERSVVIAVSEVDACGLGPDVRVVPNGCDVPASVPARDPAGPPLFVGALDYEPNREGLAWWCERVWPRLGPTAGALRVVGRGGRSALGRLAGHPALDVAGEADDVTRELALASVVVVPLRSGSGTRLKVLEALAWGRPVVSTPKGAEGLPLVHGVQALLAAGEADFARELERVRHDRLLADSLSDAGRAFVEPYDWRVVGDAFADEVIALLPTSPG